MPDSDQALRQMIVEMVAGFRAKEDALAARLDAAEQALREIAEMEWSLLRAADGVAAMREVARAALAAFTPAGRPRPDFDPRVDYPERHTEGPI